MTGAVAGAGGCDSAGGLVPGEAGLLGPGAGVIGEVLGAGLVGGVLTGAEGDGGAGGEVGAVGGDVGTRVGRFDGNALGSGGDGTASVGATGGRGAGVAGTEGSGASGWPVVTPEEGAATLGDVDGRRSRGKPDRIPEGSHGPAPHNTPLGTAVWKITDGVLDDRVGGGVLGVVDAVASWCRRPSARVEGLGASLEKIAPRSGTGSSGST